MRYLYYSLLSLATITTTLAAEISQSSEDWENAVPDTVFNGQTVPPMKELGQNDLEQEIGQGNWYDSPECAIMALKLLTIH
jgi:protein disulfide-isomerase